MKFNKGWIAFICFALLAILTKLYLIAPLPLHAIETANLDDLLFIRLAEFLRNGEWLGPFNEKTLSKGAFYPIFIALNSFTDIPLKISEYFLYVFAVVLLVVSFYKQSASKFLLFLLFLVLIFNPYVEVINRVLREGIYTSLLVLIIACFSCLFHFQERSKLLVGLISFLLGLSLFAFWNTREEGICILPSLLLLTGYLLYQTIRSKKISNRLLSGLMMILFLPISLMLHHSLKSKNKRHYGEAITCDMTTDYQSETFQAMHRVESVGEKINRVGFNNKTRRLLYNNIPSLKNLSHYLERDPLAKTGCDHYPETCNEMVTGWFVWSFRKSIYKYGHFENATTYKNYLNKITTEINQACAKGTLKCNPPKNIILAGLNTSEDWSRVKNAFYRGLKMLHNGAHHNLFPYSNFKKMDRLNLYKKMTNVDHFKIASADFWTKNIKLKAKKASIMNHRFYLTKIRSFYNIVLLKIFTWGSILMFPIICFCSLKNRIVSFRLALAIALAAIIFIRLLALSIIDATSFPGIEIRYLACLYPVLTVIFYCCVEELLHFFKKRKV